MQIERNLWRADTGWRRFGTPLAAADLVLVFGQRSRLDPACLDALRSQYPGAHLLGCSTAGEISDVEVLDDSVVATALHFARTRIRIACQHQGLESDSRRIGQALATELAAPDLRHVFVLSDGLGINGTALVEGLREALPAGVEVTGGLAGDGTDFHQTVVIADDLAASGIVAAVGFYGEHLQVGYGSLGGWDSFGPYRLITRSQGNVLYELDGQPALELYKRYLGPHAAGLPATGLLFPLALRAEDGTDVGLVRTILSVNEADGSMTFAGDLPEGCYARLMKANFERLIDGASGAAALAVAGRQEAPPPQLAVLISCVGRKLVLQQRIEEEVEGVREVLGPGPVLTGFYSYGEISPYQPTARCELHNQTMTITTFTET